MKPILTQQLREQGRQSGTAEDLLTMFAGRNSIPIDELASRVEDVRKLISSGRLYVTVLQRPWVVEFNVSLASRGSCSGSRTIEEESREKKRVDDETDATRELWVAGSNLIPVPATRVNEIHKVVQEHHGREAKIAKLAALARRVF